MLLITFLNNKQFANFCHSRITVPIDTVRFPIPLLPLAHSSLHLLGHRRLSVLPPLPTSRPPFHPKILPGTGRQLGSRHPESATEPAQLRHLLADHSVPAQLVHQSHGSDRGRAPVSVRRRDFPGGGATFFRCDTSRENSAYYDIDGFDVFLDLGRVVTSVCGRLAGTDHVQAETQEEIRVIT